MRELVVLSNDRVAIIGAGPAGLSAAERLAELGREVVVFERADGPGGLSRSVVDDAGFTWDVGGHVAFSKLDAFNRFFERHCSDWLEHEREAWTWLLGVWVPYPFQNNIHRLPPDAARECLDGLISAAEQDSPTPRNFGEWMESVFGKGVCRYFMRPDNFKRWATPAELMSADWIAERVSVVDVERVKENVALGRDDVGWGPNSRFRFPLEGGTGAVFDHCAEALGDRIQYGARVVRVSTEERRLYLEDGRCEEYDALINTAPLDAFMRAIGDAPESLRDDAGRLEHNGLHVVGIGLERPLRSTKCWMYFPEDDSPFYRVTNFSNYSPRNVPGGDVERYGSLMCETSYSRHKPVDAATIAEQTIDGLISVGLMTEADRDVIVSTHTIHEPYSYPIPTPERDAILGRVQPWLAEHNIQSVGRFGAWLYEAGNMDHSVVAGIMAAERVLRW